MPAFFFHNHKQRELRNKFGSNKNITTNNKNYPHIQERGKRQLTFFLLLYFSILRHFHFIE